MAIAAPPDAPEPAAASRLWLRLLALSSALGGALCAALIWLVASQQGFTFVWSAVAWLSDRALTVEQAQGTLWQGFVLNGVHFRQGQDDIRIDHLALSWQPRALLHRQLWLTRLTLGQVVWTTLEPSLPLVWPGLPRDLVLPLKIRVDDVRLASLSLNPEGWNAYALQAAYAYDGRQHSLRLQSLRLNQGTLGAQLSLNPHAPFALKGEVHGAQAQQAVELEASGSLQRLLLRGRVQSAQVGVDLQGVFVPFAAQPYLRIASLELHARGVDPHALQADWPHATLDAKAFLRPDPIKGVAGHLRLDNRLPGAWSEGRLPLKTLTSDFVLLDSSLRVSSMLAQLTQGQIRLQGGVRPQRLTVDAQLSGVGLRALHGALPADVVSGHLALNGSLEAPRLQARLQGQKLRVAADVDFFRQAGGLSLQLHQLLLAAGGGALTLSGQMDAQRRFSLHGQVQHADPSRIYPLWPHADINAGLQAQGLWGAQRQLALTLQFERSLWSNAPLSGHLALEWSDRRLKQLVADLQLAANRLDAQGSYGAPGDRLRLRLDAPALATLGFGFAGALRGNLDLAGVPSAPQLSLALQAQALHLPGGYRARSLDLNGELRPGASGPFQLKLAAADVQTDAWKIAALHASAVGTRMQHRIDLAGQAQWHEQHFAIAFQARGGWSQQNVPWRGVIEQGAVQGTPNLKLLAPLALAIGSERIELGATRCSLSGGQLSLDHLIRQADGELQSSGRFQNLNLAALQPWINLPLQQDLQLKGAWNLAPAQRGSLELERQGGDVVLNSASGRVQLGLSAARARIDWSPAGSRFTVKLASRLGQINAQGELADVPQRLHAGSALNARVQIELPDLAPWGALSGTQAVMGGALSASLNLTGPLLNPGIYGPVSGRALLWQDQQTGIRLSGGELAARFDGRLLLLERLHFSAGQGEVLASGRADLNGQAPEASIKVAIQHFSVFDRADRRLVVSGNGQLMVNQRRISLTGLVRADKGQLTLPKEGTPGLSSDVVVLGRSAPEPSAFASLPMTVALTLDLGDAFSFSGEGLQVALAGQVAVKTGPGSAPSARGQVRVVKGSYKAYGQELDIESGTITFVGALDNPVLNVRARRRLSPVGAGVEVQGTAADPVLHLIANQPMSERDKLAWLVLGHAADNNAQDSNVLALAAGTLAAGSLNQRVGLFDDLGVTSRESRVLLNGTVNPAEQVLTVGKQLTQTFYLGYEYGLSSSQQAVKLMYQLSGNWSVILKVGSSASTESRYTLRFD